MESQVGRKFDIVYRYHDFSGSGSDGDLVDPYEQSLAAGGRILMDTWASRIWTTGATYTWASIASGAFDASVIDPEAARVASWGQPLLLSFDHEMDGKVGTSKGTAEDYVAAYRHIHDRFAADGVTNVIWVWDVTGYAPHNSLYASLYPGDSYVDWVGYDPYNFYQCKGAEWKSFFDTIDPEYQWFMANGFGSKPFMLAEYATVQDPADPTAAGNWYRDVPSVIAGHPNIKAVLQFNATGSCDTRLSPYPETLAGFTEAGQAGIFTHTTS